MSHPLVTIAIPTYGQADVLATTIESALAQDYPALEVLVVDDASPDDTPVVAARYATDPRVKIVRHEKNMGRVATYRDTLEHRASGKYYLNLDGDDWLCDSTYVSEATRILEGDDTVAVVFARLKTYDEDSGTLTEEGAIAWNLPELCDGNAVFLKYATGAAIPHPTALYRRDLALQAGFYDHDVLGSDSVSFLRLLPGRRAAFIHRAVAVWRQHGRNASVRTSTDHLLANFAVADVPAGTPQAKAEFGAEELMRWRRSFSAQIGYRAVASQLAAGQPASAVRLLWFMLRSRPLAFAQAARLLLRGSFRFLSRYLKSSPASPRSGS